MLTLTFLSATETGGISDWIHPIPDWFSLSFVYPTHGLNFEDYVFY